MTRIKFFEEKLYPRQFNPFISKIRCTHYYCKSMTYVYSVSPILIRIIYDKIRFNSKSLSKMEIVNYGKWKRSTH